MGLNYSLGDPLHPETLKEKQRKLRDNFPLALSLRIHRALSWLRRSEEEHEDLDVRFILLWIGFNAAYAGDLDRALENAEGEGEGGSSLKSERARFDAFFIALLKMDARSRIYDLIWNRFPHEIRMLLDNRYIFGPFWQAQRSDPAGTDWEDRFDRSKRAVSHALKNHDTPTLLSILFDRLYTLRNQLVHGGATWNSDVNRDQVRDGAALLGCLLPVFVDLMMDHPSEEWSMPNYPVIEE